MKNPIKNSYGLHWFRRDLRIAGNPALRWNWKQHNGKVLGIFFFDARFLARPDFSPNRFAFFLNTLVALKEDLQELGGDLLVLDRNPVEGFQELLTSLASNPCGKPISITFNRDYEPFARKRDEEILTLLKSQSVETHTARDHLLIEPHEIVKTGGAQNFYQIYTPFARKWFELFKTTEIQNRIAAQKEGLKLLNKWNENQSPENLFQLQWKNVLSTAELSTKFQDKLASFRKKNQVNTKIHLPNAGSRTAFTKLDEFKNRLDAYNETRDFPDLEGTSKLSVFFKNGSLTTTQAIAHLKLGTESFERKTGPTQYLKELIWREFYYHILYHCPRVETEAFLEKYKDIEWENRKDYFEAWKEGQTGYPIVDAGMRELKETGFMHNRVRMIVASFLTKDLLIDWRWGEQHFMHLLLDGDLAPNNGGWQWAASTGCDPQPYFRIFNPTLQSEKFDPEGKYIKRFVPERRLLSAKALHQPINPIVDHAAQKIRTLALYTKV